MYHALEDSKQRGLQPTLEGVSWVRVPSPGAEDIRAAVAFDFSLILFTTDDFSAHPWKVL